MSDNLVIDATTEHEPRYDTLADAAAPTEQATTEILPDGTIIDQNGEIVGWAEVGSDWHITDSGKAAWVMEKRMIEDGAIKGLMAQLTAISENLDKMIRFHERRIKDLDWRFGEELAAFARANLKGKQKTWTCAYGKVSFRTTQPGIEFTDDALALAWMKSLAIPEAIKVTEKIMLSVVKEKLLADPPPAGHGIEIRPAGESVKIESGIK